MAYCIAFSIDGATDVTRRYVRNPAKHGLDRTRAPEEVLLWVIHEIRRIRRENLPKEQHHRLRKEDEREERELRAYMAQAIATEIISLVPGELSNPRSDEVKVPVPGQNGTVEWANSRSSETGQPGPDRSGHGR